MLVQVLRVQLGLWEADPPTDASAVASWTGKFRELAFSANSVS